MKRFVFILGILLVGMVTLLETSSKQKKRMNFIPEQEHDYDDVWWDN